MLRNLPSLKAKQLIRLLKSGGCEFYREGKGDHVKGNRKFTLTVIKDDKLTRLPASPIPPSKSLFNGARPAFPVKCEAYSSGARIVDL